MVSLQNFYTNFYGARFYRNFRRIPDHNGRVYINFYCTNPKGLVLHLQRNSGKHACFMNVYDYDSQDALKNNDKSGMLIDRLYFDFDITDSTFNEIKAELIALRSKGLHINQSEQLKLKNKINELLIDELAAPAIDEAMEFSRIIQDGLGSPPALFFSGAKGCHAYVFFKSIKLNSPDLAIHELARDIKDNYDFKTLDLSVNRDATSRVARIPYSKHQLTGLTVVPFDLSMDYETIIESSKNPKTTHFDKKNYFSNFDEFLVKYDDVISLNKGLNEYSKPKHVSFKRRYINMENSDQRSFFRDIIGAPQREYVNYDMYHCPFPDHHDSNPSFLVHENGYKCYGCQRKGNYWQFLKDYNNWSDEEVKKYLKSLNHS